MSDIMNKATDIIIRQATKADAPAATELMLMAFPTDALLNMGTGISYKNLVDVIVKTMQLDDAIYSYNNIIIAEVNNSAEADGHIEPDKENKTVVGVLIAYDGAKLHKLRKPLEDLLAEYIGEEAHNWDDETSAGEFYLDSLAVNPQYRGLNIGSRLIEATIRKAAALGHSKAGLLVDLENPLAEKLYTRLGFKFVNYQPFMKHNYKHLQKDTSVYCNQVL